jgi:hypothetical protein
MTSRISILAIAAGLFVGCASPRVLLTNNIVEGRSVKYVMQKTGNEVTTNSAGQTTTGQGMYDYSIILCDFDDQGKEQNCGDTLLLRNVTLAP